MDTICIKCHTPVKIKKNEFYEYGKGPLCKKCASVYWVEEDWFIEIREWYDSSFYRYDPNFIAHAKMYIPALINEVEKLHRIHNDGIEIRKALSSWLKG